MANDIKLTAPDEIMDQQTLDFYAKFFNEKVQVAKKGWKASIVEGRTFGHDGLKEYKVLRLSSSKINWEFDAITRHDYYSNLMEIIKLERLAA